MRIWHVLQFEMCRLSEVFHNVQALDAKQHQWKEDNVYKLNREEQDT